MKKPHLLGVVCALLSSLFLQSAQASVITFDDIGATGSAPIPDGYSGFNWTNMLVQNVTFLPESGYNNGVVSPDNVAFNRDGGLAVVSGSVFDFNGAYFAAAWNNGLSVNVKGYFGDALLYDTTVNPLYTGSTWYQFDFFDVDKLEFTSFGGVDANGNDGGQGTHFAMDNFNISAVPIPAAVWLFGSGLLGLVGMARRKKVA